MAAIEMTPAMGRLDSLLESSFASSTPTTEADACFSNAASLSSTPPTTVSPDSMSLASEPDIAKPESVAASSIEAVITLPENEQHESGQQTPIGQDAIVVAEQPLPTEPLANTRPRRARSSLPVYNVSKLFGTDVHGKRRSKGDAIPEKRRRTVSDAMVLDTDDTTANDSINALPRDSQDAQGEIDASGPNRSMTTSKTSKSARISKKTEPSPPPAHSTRRATRLSNAPVETITTKLSAIGKRGKKNVSKGLERISRELMRLQDTNEFARIDTRPVRYTVWSKGKYIDVDAEEAAPEPPRKKVKVDATAPEGADKVDAEKKQEPAAPAPKRPRAKKWLEKGLYAGQEAPIDIHKGLTAQEKKKLATLPELMPSGKLNRTFPPPMFNGLRMLIHGRDFKLPYDVCNPLPPGQPKPAAYRTMTKNRFVGDAAAYWKKTPHFEDCASKCVCKPEDGCGEDCQNRIMLYECDETNCNLGKSRCMNRAFQDLQERTKKGGRYRVGVEVNKTQDRGYGVRSNRCFEPNQIIMEYTGEIITEEECERRMNEVYKDNECYYLMSFDQNMIIDATTGSIARFVNHSCSPNCRMIKWIVAGQPRMALFAGDRPISTGEELTYDYNFDPFSAKNVQKCLCGSPNCRGVLGPKPKEVKPPKPKEVKKPAKSSKASVKTVKAVSAKTASAKASTKASAKVSAKVSATKTSVKTAAKRKLKDVFAFDADDDEETTNPAKKRKIKATTGVKRTLSSASLKVAKNTAKGAAKGAVATIKRSVSSISVAAKTKKKTVLTSSSSSTKKGVAKKIKVTTRKAFKRTTASSTVVKKHGAAKKSAAASTTSTSTATTQKGKDTAPSRSPSLTIVAAGVSQTPKSTPKPTTTAAAAAVSAVKTSSRKVTPSRKALEAGILEKSSNSPASPVKLGAKESPGKVVKSSASGKSAAGKARNSSIGSGGGGKLEVSRTTTTTKIRLISAGAK